MAPLWQATAVNLKAACVPRRSRVAATHVHREPADQRASPAGTQWRPCQGAARACHRAAALSWHACMAAASALHLCHASTHLPAPPSLPPRAAPALCTRSSTISLSTSCLSRARSGAGLAA